MRPPHANAMYSWAPQCSALSAAHRVGLALNGYSALAAAAPALAVAPKHASPPHRCILPAPGPMALPPQMVFVFGTLVIRGTLLLTNPHASARRSWLYLLVGALSVETDGVILFEVGQHLYSIYRMHKCRAASGSRALSGEHALQTRHG